MHCLNVESDLTAFITHATINHLAFRVWRPAPLWTKLCVLKARWAKLAVDIDRVKKTLSMRSAGGGTLLWKSHERKARLPPMPLLMPPRRTLRHTGRAEIGA